MKLRTVTMLRKSLLELLLPFCVVAATDVTFKNVIFSGCTGGFKKTIQLSNSLKDFLPESAVAKIEIRDQNIPVLYENSLADLNDLNELVLENCGIYEIQPGTLKNVSKLRTLSLKGNRIETIKEGVFNNLQLSIIDLSLNRITIIHPNAFDDLPNLLHINLTNNNIEIWNNNWFKNTPSLTTLSMQNNFIMRLPNNALKNLIGNRNVSDEKIDISIFLSCNNIKIIKPKALDGLTEVKHLWLDHNWLESFDSDLLDGIRVDDLRLDHNFRCLRVHKSNSRSEHSPNCSCDALDCLGKREAKRLQRKYCFGRASVDDEYER